MKIERNSSKFTLSAMFSLLSPSSELKVPIFRKCTVQSPLPALEPLVQISKWIFNRQLACCLQANVILKLSFWTKFMSNLLLISFSYLQIAPNAGIMFLSFEYTKRVFLFYNGYTESPFSNVPKSHVDQSMSPNELSHHFAKKKGPRRWQ